MRRTTRSWRPGADTDRFAIQNVSRRGFSESWSTSAATGCVASARWPVVAIDLTREPAEGPDNIAGVDDHVALDRAFAHLTPDQRLTVALRFYSDLTVDEIAYRTRVPAGTVKSRLHAATRRLQEALGVHEEIAP